MQTRRRRNTAWFLTNLTGALAVALLAASAVFIARLVIGAALPSPMHHAWEGWVCEIVAAGSVHPDQFSWVRFFELQSGVTKATVVETLGKPLETWQAPGADRSIPSLRRPTRLVLLRKIASLGDP